MIEGYGAEEREVSQRTPSNSALKIGEGCGLTTFRADEITSHERWEMYKIDNCSSAFGFMFSREVPAPLRTYILGTKASTDATTKLMPSFESRL